MPDLPAHDAPINVIESSFRISIRLAPLRRSTNLRNGEPNNPRPAKNHRSVSFDSDHPNQMRREFHQVDNPPSYEAQRHYSPNVLIVGETGVGKSSVVNLIAGEPLATVHSGAGACTMEATSYDIILPDDQGLSHHIRLFDTVGLNEPQFRKTDYLTAIEKANTLICQLQRTGGIRLLLFCIRGGRITAVMQNNYRLFCDILCQNKVPVAFVITGLENEVSMEGWWERNVSSFEAYRLSCASHACVTAIRGLNNCYAKRFHESQTTVRAMLLAHVTAGGTSWQPERTGWFIHLAGKLLRWLSQIRGRRRQALTVEELARHLQDKCKFSQSEAVYLAAKIWTKRQENAGPDFVKSDDDSSSIDSL